MQIVCHQQIKSYVRQKGELIPSIIYLRVSPPEALAEKPIEILINLVFYLIPFPYLKL